MRVSANFKIFNLSDSGLRIYFKTNTDDAEISDWYGPKELEAFNGNDVSVWTQETKGDVLKAMVIEVLSKATGYYVKAFDHDDLDINCREFDIKVEYPLANYGKTHFVDPSNKKVIQVTLVARDGQTEIVGPLTNII